MDRSTIIVLAVLLALLIVEFVWLEARARRKKRKASGQEMPTTSANSITRRNGKNSRR